MNHEAATVTTPARLAAPHRHYFLGADHDRNARRVGIVIALTAATMVAEIVAGSVYGSMALVADGWHMATHAGAMLIAALAYRQARLKADDPRFTFGTGKFGDLAGFASAVLLALVALLIGWESLMRLYAPVEIDFSQAILVAVIGLVVNLVSAWLLRDVPHDHGHDHHHGHAHGHHHGHGHAHHDHEHGHGHGHGHHDHGHAAHAHAARTQARAGHDNNLKAAYLHVLADALTSVLAIAALVAGSLYGWAALDPLMGVVGALVIARWSLGLIRRTALVLVDGDADSARLAVDIRSKLGPDAAEITDLHVWPLGPGHHGAIVSVRSREPSVCDAIRAKLADMPMLSHLTVEVSTPVAG